MNVFHRKAWNPGFAKLVPLFFPIMPYGAVFAKFKNWPSIGALNEFKPKQVSTFLSHNICFVEQKATRREKNFSSLYEPRIFLQGEINTRAQSWHDFFNALIWYTFPKIKSTLNMRQFIAFDERASFPWKTPLRTRTREQDLLTMFDEGGCILVTLEGKVNCTIPVLFGHGFYERILYGDQDLSASTLEITLNNHSLFQKCFQSNKFVLTNEILFEIDTVVSSLLADRNYYKKAEAFRSVHMNEMLSLLQKISIE